jgi:flagellar biosynthetic protein FliO
MNKIAVVLILVWSLGGVVQAAQAESPATGEAQTVGQNTLETSDALGKLVTSTLAIIVLGVVAVYVVKRVMPKVSSAMGKELRVIESMSLGPRKQIHIVKVGRRKLLVGSGTDSVTCLADVTDALPDGAVSQTGGGRNE